MSVSRALGWAAVCLLLGRTAFASTWQLVQPMPLPRTYHASATVGNAWYVAGGEFLTAGQPQFPTEVDRYDPSRDTWSPVGQLSSERKNLVAIPAPDGTGVLFIGGFLPAGPDGYLALGNCDLATPTSVSAVTSLVDARQLHAVAEASGRIVVTGGWGMDAFGSRLLDDGEMSDTASGGWKAAGTLPGGPRASQSMTTLANGTEILVAGGCQSTGPLSDVSILDVEAGTWRATAPLKIARCRHTAALLPDGRVLVTGGLNGSATAAEASTEIFDPSTETWTTGPALHDGRYEHNMVALPDGRLVVAGGSADPVNGELGALASAEIYDPVSNGWVQLPSMNDRRRSPSMVTLSDGVYVAGGSYADNSGPLTAIAIASVERLTWSDLGIDPVNPDGGNAGGDGGEGGDGGVDTIPDANVDESGDGKTGLRDSSGGGGCSCFAVPAGPQRGSTPLMIVLAGLAEGVRRSRKRRGPR